jgi:hypothetical protein
MNREEAISMSRSLRSLAVLIKAISDSIPIFSKAASSTSSDMSTSISSAMVFKTLAVTLALEGAALSEAARGVLATGLVAALGAPLAIMTDMP